VARDFLMNQDFLFLRLNRFFQVAPSYQALLTFLFFQIRLWVLVNPDFLLVHFRPYLLLLRECQENQGVRVFRQHQETLEHLLSHLFLLNLVVQMDLLFLALLEDLRVPKAPVVPLVQKILLLLFRRDLLRFLWHHQDQEIPDGLLGLVVLAYQAVLFYQEDLLAHLAQILHPVHLHHPFQEVQANLLALIVLKVPPCRDPQFLLENP